MIKHYNDEDFGEVLKKNRVLVDFYATWCGPCKMLGPVLEKLDEKNLIEIAKIDVDHAGKTSTTYGVFSVPTLILFENGKEIKRQSGFMSLDQLEKFVNEKN